MKIHHSVCWADIPVLDLPRATAFYSAVLAAQLEIGTIPGLGDYALLPYVENSISGCLVPGPAKPSMDGPLVYLNVDGRLDAAVAATHAGGGAVLVTKHPLGPHGFRVIIRDTEGNRLALHSTVA